MKGRLFQTNTWGVPLVPVFSTSSTKNMHEEGSELKSAVMVHSWATVGAGGTIITLRNVSAHPAWLLKKHTTARWHPETWHWQQMIIQPFCKYSLQSITMESGRMWSWINSCFDLSFYLNKVALHVPKCEKDSIRLCYWAVMWFELLRSI